MRGEAMKTLISFVTFSLLLLLAPAMECQTKYGSNEQVGKYVDVNDIKVYYEIYGAGEPLLLLHGNSGSIANFVYQIPELSKHFKVIAVDSRAQGKSTDSDKEITYALMASDMSALIDKLNLGSVYVVGWSDGGNVGLELALAHPQQVKKLVTFGANYTHENASAPPDNIAMEPNDPRLLQITPMMKQFKEGLDKLPPAKRKKLTDLMDKYPNLTVEQLKQIKVPVLVIAGDRDAINFDQTISLFRSLPHSQLFIVPGATHFEFVEQPEFFNSEVINFLSTPYRDLDRYYWMSFFVPVLPEAFRAAVERRGFDHAGDIYAEMRKENPDFKLDEGAMNSWAYRLMGENHLPEATALLKLNVQMYPESWNVYDSLGEAYMKAGQKELAIENYKKSLEKNPNNTNAKDMLKKLEGGPVAPK
jgi:pimeloyl-ACP methyl ester carboxylesterase